MYFARADDYPLGRVQIGGFRAADRGNVTKLMRDSRTGLVPPGTRNILLTFTANRETGPYNDGYADDLSLVLPEPGAPAEEAFVLSTLALMSRRRIGARPPA
jgi:hypothetical protein